MIYRNSPIADHTLWTRDPNPDAGTLAAHFLEGERELLRIAHPRSVAAAMLTDFLEDAAGAPILVHRAATGELLISTGASSETLLLTGKTAEVLRSYLDDEPVSMRDRADMTVRRRIA